MIEFKFLKNINFQFDELKVTNKYNGINPEMIKIINSKYPFNNLSFNIKELICRYQFSIPLSEIKDFFLQLNILFKKKDNFIPSFEMKFLKLINNFIKLKIKRRFLYLSVNLYFEYFEIIIIKNIPHLIYTYNDEITNI